MLLSQRMEQEQKGQFLMEWNLELLLEPEAAWRISTKQERIKQLHWRPERAVEQGNG